MGWRHCEHREETAALHAMKHLNPENQEEPLKLVEQIGAITNDFRTCACEWSLFIGTRTVSRYPAGTIFTCRALNTRIAFLAVAGASNWKGT
jgi:hypothetical protein